jgi:ABC-type nitrate/sulfonate/bicarbonate transport system substrate-binding protein
MDGATQLQSRAGNHEQFETMSRSTTRRRFGFAATAALGLRSGSGAAKAADLSVTRAAIALRAAFQSVAWVGAEAGIFKRHGVEVTFTLETGGPRAAAGTASGDWEFCHTGDLPIVEGVAQGQDPVLIVAPTAPHEAAFLMARRDITKPEQLANARIGGVDAKGQFGQAVQALLEKWGVSATVVSLGSFQTIYKALGAGEIDAGYLPVDLRFLGENEFGLNAIAGLPVGAGGIVTTRRLIAANRELVSQFVQASVDTIALFKTQPDVVVPLLQRFLGINDRKSVEQLLGYYTPLFQSNPRPTFASEIPQLRDIVARKFPAASNLKPEDLVDASFVDELDRTGYIERLYSKAK